MSISVTFLATALLVIMTPGPAMALITHLVLTQPGPRPAVAAVLGMVAATAAKILLAVAGLATLLATNPTLLTALRVAGAIVLLGWAAVALRAALSPAQATDLAPPHSDRRAFLQGLLCSGINPQTGVFLLAFLPQFVPPGVPPAGAVTLLAVVFLLLGLAWLLVWTKLVRRLARFAHTATTTRILNMVTAAAFVTFAIRLT